MRCSLHARCGRSEARHQSESEDQCSVPGCVMIFSGVVCNVYELCTYVRCTLEIQNVGIGCHQFYNKRCHFV